MSEPDPTNDTVADEVLPMPIVIMPEQFKSWLTNVKFYASVFNSPALEAVALDMDKALRGEVEEEGECH